MDSLEELKILYAELQTYLWVTRLFIEQNNDSAEVVEALHKLKGQIVDHSAYLAQRPDLLDRNKSLILADLDRMGHVAIQGLDALLANTPNPKALGFRQTTKYSKFQQMYIISWCSCAEK